MKKQCAQAPTIIIRGLALRSAVLLAVCVSAIAVSGVSFAASSSSSPVIATVAGHQITQKQVDDKLKSQLASMRNQLYQMQVQAIDSIADDLLVEAAAKKAGLSKEAYLKREIEDKVISPPDAQVQALYDQHKAQINQPLDKIKPQLVNYIKAQQERQVRDQLFAKLRAGSDLKIAISPPRYEVAAGGFPSVGPKDAPITIVEFSDFQCPYCKRAEDALKVIREKYGDKVRLVYRDYPLPMHQNAEKAAEAGLCAQEQGKFWPLHDVMFNDQSKLSPPELKASAAKAGLDSGKFNQCLDQSRYADAVHKSADAGSDLGVDGTPAFYINGRFLGGAQPPQAFEQIIDDELARGGQKQASAAK